MSEVLLTLYLRETRTTFVTAEKPVDMPILPVGSTMYIWNDNEGDPLEIINWVYEFDGTLRCILDDQHCDTSLIPYLERAGFFFGAEKAAQGLCFCDGEES